MSSTTEIPEEIAALRQTDEAVVVVDHAGNIVAMSAPAEDLFGISESDIAGEAVELLIPEELRFGHQAYRRGYLAEPADREMDPGLEPQLERPMDGQRVPIAVRLVPHRAAGRLYVAAHVTPR
jgi:PAS domain S-box-containing protein